MNDRLAAEIEMLRNEYPDLQVGEELKWLLIPNFPLPPGQYNLSSTRLLVLLQATYPHVPPDNFYVDAGLRLGSGATPGSYREGVGIPISGNWAMFSWHCEPGGWQAGPTPEAGDNLSSFLRSVRLRLREGQ